MRQTPRKNKLIRRPKDESRFRWYLLARVGWVVLSVFIVGWLTAASRPLSSVDRWSARMTSMTDLLEKGEFHSPGLSQFCHVQDIMSAQFLLGIVTQSITLLHRGQSMTQLSSPRSHPEYFFAIFLCLSLHIGILVLRARTRDNGLELYSRMDREVWIAMGICPLVGMALGVAINRDDNFSYQRHLQFLRLEFDTRLGMHSPR